MANCNPRRSRTQRLRDASSLLAWTLALLATLACGDQKTEFRGYKPATVEHGDESSLSRITLHPDAARRLGIATAAPEERKAQSHLRAAGEITIAPGSSAVVTAPVSGIVTAAKRRGEKPLVPGAQLAAGDVVLELSPLVTPNRDLRLESERDLQSAKARFDTASSNEKRLIMLGEQGAGDQNALEQAEAARAVAEAELSTARKRLSRLSSGNPLSSDITLPLRSPQAAVLLRLQVAIGQSVAAGTPLFEVADLDHPWVTANIYVGDLPRIDRTQPAIVQAFGERESHLAMPLPTPAQGNAATATASLQYQLQGDTAALIPGQRVEVRLPLASAQASFTTVPEAAMLYDLNGNAWAYAEVAEHSYERRPLDIAFMKDHVAYLKTPLPTGEKVVVQGAAELFGTEFGAGK